MFVVTILALPGIPIALFNIFKFENSKKRMKFSLILCSLLMILFYLTGSAFIFAINGKWFGEPRYLFLFTLLLCYFSAETITSIINISNLYILPNTQFNEIFSLLILLIVLLPIISSQLYIQLTNQDWNYNFYLVYEEGGDYLSQNFVNGKLFITSQQMIALISPNHRRLINYAKNYTEYNLPHDNMIELNYFMKDKGITYFIFDNSPKYYPTDFPTNFTLSSVLNPVWHSSVRSGHQIQIFTYNSGR